MPVVEKNSLMKYKDKSGNTYILYPITNTDNVDGLDEVVAEAKKLDTAVAATSTDGVAYTATVPGYHGSDCRRFLHYDPEYDQHLSQYDSER